MQKIKIQNSPYSVQRVCVRTPTRVCQNPALVQDLFKEVIVTKENLNSYSKQDLIQIIRAYDRYIIEFYDEHDCMGDCPVCLDEFIDNDLEFYM